MADIDNLTIRVNATARNATAGIDAIACSSEIAPLLVSVRISFSVREK